jgi:hypothetical protein
VAEAAGIGLVSNAAHPGCALTNLQKSGPGPKAKWVAAIEKMMASLMSQDAAHGALPTLRAATTMDAAQGKVLCAGSDVWSEGRSNPYAGSEAGEGRGGRAAALGDFAEVDRREISRGSDNSGMLKLAFQAILGE